MMRPEQIIGLMLGSVNTFATSTYMLRERIEGAIRRGEYPDIDLSTTVAIHLPTLNEEHFVEDTLRTLVSQPLYEQYNPSKLKIVLIDSHSDDRTVEIAEQYVDEVIFTPRGKLTARRIAIERETADIIVAVDAGTLYPEGWLNWLLMPFSDTEVVAVGGTSLYMDPVPWYVQLGVIWANLGNFLSGRNSAFRREAWYAAGGWDESIDQTDAAAMVIEEEVNFWTKMSKVGKVVKELRAVCYESPRRFACDIYSGYCEMIERGVRF